ncbi:MAG: hypothetical protein J3Q66DRAFT_88811 [Benniella sp.]|nr:MAG: hypothetical protein J3Q66DRAFT_88811 [Benniella sp.]
MAIMPITSSTLQSPSSSLESSSGAKTLKTMPLPRTGSQPFYDKDLPPTPTSSSHLGAPDIVASSNGTALSESSDHTPTRTPVSPASTLPSKVTTTSAPLEPTPDNSSLQLAASTPSSSSTSTSTSAAAPATPMLPVQAQPAQKPHQAQKVSISPAASPRALDRPQSIALASVHYEREDMLPQYSSPSDNNTRERAVSKRVTLMGPLPHHPSDHAHEYRPSGPESAVILSQDNTPSSSRTTTNTTRTSTTPEPSNGFHAPQHHGPERNGDDRALVSTSHRRPESLNSNNNQLTSDYTNGDHHSTTSSSQPDGQSSQGHPAEAGTEDPSRIKPRRVLGNYHMSKTLGAGSMGKVKLGVHSRTRDKTPTGRPHPPSGWSIGLR